MDIHQQINSVSRRVDGRILEAGEARTVTISQSYDTSLEDLWDACTNAERIPRWFLPVSGELRLGGSYKLEGNASGVIERCEPPRFFSATWEFGGKVSWIEVRLSSESSERTRLEIEHIALVDDDTWAQFGPGAVGIGWDGALLGLANHISGAGGVDPSTAGAWMVSDEGLAFMRMSGEAWREAHIEAGGDPDAANAAAARTAAAYGVTIPQRSPAAGHYRRSGECS
jgi:uncharacterized protein YndB with AHSA1/START domain